MKTSLADFVISIVALGLFYRFLVRLHFGRPAYTEDWHPYRMSEGWLTQRSRKEYKGLTVLCAWCRPAHVIVEGDPHRAISHGICEKALAAQVAELEKDKT